MDCGCQTLVSLPSIFSTMDWSRVSSLLFHPVIFWLIELLLFIFIIGFTSPTAILRPAVVPVMVACICKVVSISPTLLRGPWSAWGCAAIMNLLMHYVECALIAKWNFTTQSPTSSAAPQMSVGKRNTRSESTITTQTHGGTFRERFRFGYVVLTSSRNIGTPYMVKGTPEFSPEDPNYIPSRRAFLFRKAAIILLAFLTLELTSQAAQPLEYNEVVFSAEAVPIFRGSRENLTREKIIFRLVTVMGYWLVFYMVVNGIISFFNFLNVALGIEDVRSFRPNFGPIREAYSLRQFWSVFWHQNLRKSLSAPADVVVYKVLRFSKGALITRYLHLSLVFLFSGLVHEFTDIAEGFPRSYVGSIHFFMTQAVGIMLEDVVQALYRAIRGAQRDTPPTTVARAIGYIWVTLFLCWSTPMWTYARQSAMRGEQSENLLPFSLLGLLNKI